jgi:hypothetical protein
MDKYQTYALVLESGHLADDGKRTPFYKASKMK